MRIFVKKIVFLKKDFLNTEGSELCCNTQTDTHTPSPVSPKRLCLSSKDPVARPHSGSPVPEPQADGWRNVSVGDETGSSSSISDAGQMNEGWETPAQNKHYRLCGITGYWALDYVGQKSTAIKSNKKNMHIISVPLLLIIVSFLYPF